MVLHHFVDETPDPCSDALVCSNNGLVTRPGYTEGMCESTGQSLTCLCQDGYAFDSALNICKGK